MNEGKGAGEKTAQTAQPEATGPSDPEQTNANEHPEKRSGGLGGRERNVVAHRGGMNSEKVAEFSGPG